MLQTWIECVAGSGVWWRAFHHKGFGPVSVLVLELGEGRLAVVSAPKAATDAEFAELDAFGEVEALIAPNLAHVSGLKHWLSCYPHATWFAPDDKQEAFERKTGLSFQPLSTLDTTAGLTLYSAPQTRSGATWIRSERGQSPVVYLDELIINMDQRPENWASQLAYRLTGTEPGLGINKAFTKLLCQAPRTTLKQAFEFSQDAAVILPAHGQPTTEPGELAKVRALLTPD